MQDQTIIFVHGFGGRKYDTNLVKHIVDHAKA